MSGTLLSRGRNQIFIPDKIREKISLRKIQVPLRSLARAGKGKEVK